MKRILMILSVLVLLSVGFAGPVAAKGGTPDVTPPVIWGIGNSSPVYLTKVCYEMDQTLMVQAKVADAGGVERVWVQWKQPGDTTWHNKNLTVRADGYWRTTVRGPFVNAGTGVFRIRAMDWGGNVTTSGIRSFAIHGCTKTIV